MNKNHYHTINAKEVLSEIFTLSKREQKEYALAFLIDLARGDVDMASTQLAKDVITKTDTFRQKMKDSGRRGGVQRQLNLKPIWEDENE